jgi:hypothetical protein
LAHKEPISSKILYICDRTAQGRNKFKAKVLREIYGQQTTGKFAYSAVWSPDIQVDFLVVGGVPFHRMACSLNAQLFLIFKTVSRISVPLLHPKLLMI